MVRSRPVLVRNAILLIQSSNPPRVISISLPRRHRFAVDSNLDSAKSHWPCWSPFPARKPEKHRPPSRPPYTVCHMLPAGPHTPAASLMKHRNWPKRAKPCFAISGEAFQIRRFLCVQPLADAPQVLFHPSSNRHRPMRNLPANESERVPGRIRVDLWEDRWLCRCLVDCSTADMLRLDSKRPSEPPGARPRLCIQLRPPTEKPPRRDRASFPRGESLDCRFRFRCWKQTLCGFQQSARLASRGSSRGGLVAFLISIRKRDKLCMICRRLGSVERQMSTRTLQII
mmetsp:Transcript_4281/g.10195  ORF Transcript_4281/g.10195 Transcript_4281/m.10195 type:complete len:285 (-) Transcript_4281:6-860(-)